MLHFKEICSRRIRSGGELHHGSPGTAKLPFSALLSHAATGCLLHATVPHASNFVRPISQTVVGIFFVEIVGVEVFEHPVPVQTVFFISRQALLAPQLE